MNVESALHFDEEWYQSAYTDIREAFNAGKITDLYRHYLEHGVVEGRLPFPPQLHNDRVFAYGSFGSHNVGDEAIIEGIHRLYPQCVQFYSNKVRKGQGVFAHDAIRNPSFFRAGDYLIIGGGGLLYDRPTVKLMADLAQSASQRGAVVDILRLGCEAANEVYFDDIRRLFSFARNISVRSTESRNIMKRITGNFYPVEFDFAFLLKPAALEMRRNLDDIPKIGIVTASADIDEVRLIANFVKYATRTYSPKIKFVHIPHSRSYFNLKNNDCITAEMIWTLSEMQNAWGSEAYTIVPYNDDPISVLAMYRSLDGVISSRYHGLVFSQIAEIPALALGGKLIKLNSFISDHRSPLLATTEPQNLIEDFARFYDLISHRRDLSHGIKNNN